MVFDGPIAEEDRWAVTPSALRGFLQANVYAPVTFVNAPVIACDRGIEYSETRSSELAD